MAVKTTRIHNKTEDKMAFVTMEEKSKMIEAGKLVDIPSIILKTKMIEAGKHIDIPYRHGRGSSSNYIKILYEIYPKDKNNGQDLGAILFPHEVYVYSEIKISYDTESSKVTLAYETGGFIQRLRMVRWIKDLFSG